MAEDQLRLFVAVPLPAEAIEACSSLIDGIRTGPLGRVPRWVHVPNLHLTVRFIGDVPAGRVPEVEGAVRDALTGAVGFDVVLAGAGSFPSQRKPRTLWLGIEEGAESLGELAAAVDGALVPLGWAPDQRAYRPHLTIARLDAAPITDSVAVAEAIGAAARDWRVAFRANRVVLFRSHLGGGPPRHEALLEVPLA